MALNNENHFSNLNHDMQLEVFKYLTDMELREASSVSHLFGDRVSDTYHSRMREVVGFFKDYEADQEFPSFTKRIILKWCQIKDRMDSKILNAQRINFKDYLPALELVEVFMEETTHEKEAYVPVILKTNFKFMSTQLSNEEPQGYRMQLMPEKVSRIVEIFKRLDLFAEISQNEAVFRIQILADTVKLTRIEKLTEQLEQKLNISGLLDSDESTKSLVDRLNALGGRLGELEEKIQGLERKLAIPSELSPIPGEVSDDNVAILRRSQQPGIMTATMKSICLESDPAKKQLEVWNRRLIPKNANHVTCTDYYNRAFGETFEYELPYKAICFGKRKSLLEMEAKYFGESNEVLRALSSEELAVRYEALKQEFMKHSAFMDAISRDDIEQYMPVGCFCLRISNHNEMGKEILVLSAKDGDGFFNSPISLDSYGRVIYQKIPYPSLSTLTQFVKVKYPHPFNPEIYNLRKSYLN